MIKLEILIGLRSGNWMNSEETSICLKGDDCGEQQMAELEPTVLAAESQHSNAIGVAQRQPQPRGEEEKGGRNPRRAPPLRLAGAFRFQTAEGGGRTGFRVGLGGADVPPARCGATLVGTEPADAAAAARLCARAGAGARDGWPVDWLTAMNNYSRAAASDGLPALSD